MTRAAEEWFACLAGLAVVLAILFSKAPGA